MSALKERIMEVADLHHLTVGRFEKTCELVPTTIYKMGDSLSVKNFALILRALPDTAPFWLVTGQKDPKLGDESKESATLPYAPQKTAIDIVLWPFLCTE